MLLAQMHDTSRYGKVLLDDEGRVTCFEEKGSLTGPGWINAGIYLLGASWKGFLPNEKSRWSARFFPPGSVAGYMAIPVARASWTLVRQSLTLRRSNFFN